MNRETKQLIEAIQSLLNKLANQLENTTNYHSLSPARLSVLNYLIENGPSSLKSIARHRKVSAASMSKLVASLVADSYVLKAQSKNDRRSKLFFVTSVAKDKVAEENQRRIILLKDRLKSLTDEQQRHILKSIELLKYVL